MEVAISIGGDAAGLGEGRQPRRPVAQRLLSGSGYPIEDPPVHIQRPNLMRPGHRDI
jgi:hypothetical protein